MEKIAQVLGVSVMDIKSPTPIIMSLDTNFHNHLPQFPESNSSHDPYINEKILDELFSQIKIKDIQISIKDKQIQELIAIINSNKL